MPRFLVVTSLALAMVAFSAMPVRSQDRDSNNQSNAHSNNQSNNATDPMIHEAHADFQQGVLLIQGESFGRGTPRVYVDHQELTVLWSSPIEIQALLTPMPPGAYRLTVVVEARRNDRQQRQYRQDTIDITIGTVGPQGPEGPQGLPGVAAAQGLPGPLGPAGPAGVSGPAGAVGPQGSAGPAGSPGPAGAMGPQGLAGAAGPQGPAGQNGAAGAQGPQGPQGPAGLAGPQGVQGPLGPLGLTGSAGPQGLAGATLVAERTWNESTTVMSMTPPDWVTLDGSNFQATTTGGALLIQMSVSMIGEPRVTCAPFIDGEWAGSVAQPQMPGWNDPTPFWRDGFMQTSGGWAQWRASRVYPNVPAGDPHVFEVRCATRDDSLPLYVNDPGGGGEFYSYISVLELR